MVVGLQCGCLLRSVFGVDEVVLSAVRNHNYLVELVLGQTKATSKSKHEASCLLIVCSHSWIVVCAMGNSWTVKNSVRLMFFSSKRPKMPRVSTHLTVAARRTECSPQEGLVGVQHLHQLLLVDLL